MRYGLNGEMLLPQIADPVVILPPTFLPVSVDELKVQCRIRDHDDEEEDAMLERLIKAAIGFVQDETGLYLIDTTLEMRLDRYPSQRVIALRGPWLQHISFQYTGDDGLDDVDDALYIVEASYKNRAPRIVPADNATWPTTHAVSDSLRVRWRAGFADRTGSPTEGAEQIPAELLSAVLLHAEAHYYKDERMMDKLITAAENLCAPHKVNFGIA